MKQTKQQMDERRRYIESLVYLVNMPTKRCSPAPTCIVNGSSRVAWCDETAEPCRCASNATQN